LKNPMARRTCEVFGGKYRSERISPIPADKALLLSGTPFLNRPDELYTQISYLDPSNWPTFKEFVKSYYDQEAKVDDQLRVTGSPQSLDQLQRKLRDTIMIRQLKCDVLKLPPKEYETRWVDHTLLPAPLLGWFQEMRRRIVITNRKLRSAKSKADRRELRERLNELLE